MRRKPVAISRLAYYASDPSGFVQNAGRARNPRAAEHGQIAHRNVVRQPAPIKAVLVYCLVLIVTLLFLYLLLYL